MTTKICTTCKEIKLIEEFYKSKLGKNGYHSKCKPCEKLRAIKYYNNNLNKIKQYYQENKEWLLINRNEYNHKNKEMLKIKTSKRRATNKGKLQRIIHEQKRRTNKANSQGIHTATQILNLFELQSGKCVYCDTKLNKSGNNKYHVDHIMPLSKGGSNDISNIQLLCPTCNMSKHNKMPDIFAQQFNKLF